MPFAPDIETKHCIPTAEQQLVAMELLELAMNTQREIADVNVEWMPHVNGIGVKIYDGGWREYKTPDFDRTIYFYEAELGGSIEQLLRETTAHLQKAKP